MDSIHKSVEFALNDDQGRSWNGKIFRSNILLVLLNHPEFLITITLKYYYDLSVYMVYTVYIFSPCCTCILYYKNKTVKRSEVIELCEVLYK